MAQHEDEGIERIASDARRVLGIERVLRPDMVTAMLKAQRLGFISSYERVADDLMPDDLAAFDPDCRRLRLRERVFVSANEVVGSPRDRPRARFTIAHEFVTCF